MYVYITTLERYEYAYVYIQNYRTQRNPGNNRRAFGGCSVAEAFLRRHSNTKRIPDRSCGHCFLWIVRPHSGWACGSTLGLHAVTRDIDSSAATVCCPKHSAARARSPPKRPWSKNWASSSRRRAANDGRRTRKTSRGARSSALLYQVRRSPCLRPCCCAGNCVSSYSDFPSPCLPRVQIQSC